MLQCIQFLLLIVFGACAQPVTSSGIANVYVTWLDPYLTCNYSVYSVQLISSRSHAGLLLVAACMPISVIHQSDRAYVMKTLVDEKLIGYSQGG